jgi:hypothetical protein
MYRIIAIAEAGTIRMRFSTPFCARHASWQNHAHHAAMAVTKARCGRSTAMVLPPIVSWGREGTVIA